MKSIRLSLIVYFLALIALALGGVSALSYQSASMTLQDKQASTEDLIDAQFQVQCRDAHLALDRRILRQAQRLAIRARSVAITYDSLFPIMAIGMGAGPVSHISTPLWTGEKYSEYVSFRLRWARPLIETQIPDADDSLPMEWDHPLEFFQTYRKNGVPIQRSASLKEQWFALDAATRDQAEAWRERFDDVELGDLKLRRVTLKAHVVGSRFGPALPWRFFPPPTKQKAPPKLPPGQMPTALPRPPYDQTAPVFYIQYAGDTAQVLEQVRQFEAERDARLARSHEETQAALVHLRQRLFWIGVLTFAGIIVGGYLLLRLGLAPLARLSDAVSQVSERDFHLHVDETKLPSELRPIAERLRLLLEELQQAFAREKQAAADISHELRTPLAALMTTLDVALRKKRTPEEYRDILDECRASGKHMSHLVERLMALARLDAGVDRLSPEPVEVSELAQQCADMVRPLAEEQGLTLRTHLADSVIAHTDAGKMRDILLNLLHNAIAYNKPAGKIELTVERVASQVHVAVHDTGIGISPESKARLFERFFRADPSRHADSPHCGLGLAIVKSYVDLLGGTIHVDSSPAGSVFEVRLPLREELTAASVESEDSLQTAAN